MSGVWVDPETGELLAEQQQGAIWLEEDEDPSPPSRFAEREDFDWLGDYVTRKEAELAAAEEAAKAAYALTQRRLKAQRAVVTRWHSTLAEVVADQLAGSKRKSVVFAYGTAGFRRSKAVEVVDEEQAIAWALEHAQDAVKVERRLLKSLLPEDCPGVERVERETFYVRPAKGGAS